jgi:imidazolonepropionase-like amidohydrolase
MTQRWVVTGARVFDGERVLAADSVVVEDDLIVAVGTSLPGAAGDQLIKAEGATLLPGLIDAHAHVGSRGALRRALRFGVTTVCDMFMDWRLAAELRAAETSGEASDVAALFSAGTLVTAPGGHGTRQLVGAIPTLGTAGEAERFVAERIAEGSEWIKVVYDGLKILGEHLPTLDFPTLSAVVKAAHRQSRKVVVHIGGLDGARDAVTAGADVLGHWVADAEPDADLVDEMARRGVVVIPTLSMLGSLLGQPRAELAEDPILHPYLSERDRAELVGRLGPPDNPIGSMQVARAGVGRLAGAGIPILAGTDAPFPGMAHGVSLHGELQALVEAGITPNRALAAATVLPARHLGLADRGRIAEGQRADLMLVRGDPTLDIAATRDILRLWKAGRPVERPIEAENLFRPPVVPSSGRLAEREGTVVTATCGVGWMPFTDQQVGARSTAELRAVDDPSAPEGWAIEISGYLDQSGTSAWAGLAFHPGDRLLAPADLSAWSGLGCWLRQDGEHPAAAMLVPASRSRANPSTVWLQPGRVWIAQQVVWGDFDGSDGHDVRAIAVLLVGPPGGAFRFHLASPQLIRSPAG